MALRAAYEDLQLDPDDHAQVAAFSKFCWQHILEHMTTRRVVEFRDGTVLLQWQKRSKISELSCTERHRVGDIDTPASCNSQERSGGYVRLRFTYCGA
jgi:hypothetical protein